MKSDPVFILVRSQLTTHSPGQIQFGLMLLLCGLFWMVNEIEQSSIKIELQQSISSSFVDQSYTLLLLKSTFQPILCVLRGCEFFSINKYRNVDAVSIGFN